MMGIMSQQSQTMETMHCFGAWAVGHGPSWIVDHYGCRIAMDTSWVIMGHPEAWTIVATRLLTGREHHLPVFRLGMSISFFSVPLWELPPSGEGLYSIP